MDFKPASPKKPNPYIEIYIDEEGTILFTPVTNSTINVLKTIIDQPEALPVTYCG